MIVPGNSSSNSSRTVIHPVLHQTMLGQSCDSRTCNFVSTIFDRHVPWFIVSARFADVQLSFRAVIHPVIPDHMRTKLLFADVQLCVDDFLSSLPMVCHVLVIRGRATLHHHIPGPLIHHRILGALIHHQIPSPMSVNQLTPTLHTYGSTSSVIVPSTV